jgi:hypothetical protein
MCINMGFENFQLRVMLIIEKWLLKILVSYEIVCYMFILVFLVRSNARAMSYDYMII